MRDRSSRLRKKNLSWGAGVLSGNRPYFAEYWNLHQLGTLRHFLTLYISSEGIEKEGLRDADLIHALGLEELAESADGGHPYAEVATYTDHSGKEFFTLRMLIIEEWGKTVINWKGKLFPYKLLHQMNGKEDKSDLTDDQDW